VICFINNRILPILAYVGAPIIIWVIWCSPWRRSVMGNSLTRCLILNFVVLLLGAALLRWPLFGPWSMQTTQGTYLRHDDPIAVLGAGLLIVTNLGIAVYLGWRIWTTIQRGV
jgi:hypothetical protein